MRSGWYRCSRSVLDDLESGKLSMLDFSVLHFLELDTDHRNGIAMSSAEKIAAVTHGLSYKTIQRSLGRLEKIGRIKRWMVKGKRGNYPVMCCPYFVLRSVRENDRDGVHEWKVTSLEKTTDWRNVQFDSVHDGVHDVVRRSVHTFDDVVSGVQEVRSEELRSDGRTKRDVPPESGGMPPEDGGAIAPQVSGQRIESAGEDDMVERLGHRELKALKKSLERTLRDRRIPAAFQETIRQKLNRVVSLLGKNS